MSILSSNKKKKQYSEEELQRLFDKSQKLIKKATSLKNKDINKAIELIYKAIDTYPKKDLDHYFKLAGYHHKAGEKERAYKVLYDLLNDEDIEDIFHYQVNLSKIYDKLTILLYRDQRFIEYIDFSLISGYYDL